MKRVIFCGGRNFKDYDAILHRARAIQAKHGPFFIIEGGQRGADALARRAGEELGLPVATVWANWDFFGKKAGGIRNGWMHALDPDAVEAFPDPESVGTWNMVRLARAHNVLTTVHHPEVLAA